MAPGARTGTGLCDRKVEGREEKREKMEREVRNTVRMRLMNETCILVGE